LKSIRGPFNHPVDDEIQKSLKSMRSKVAGPPEVVRID